MKEAAAVVTVVLLAASVALAADGTWIYDGGGDWSDMAKWQGGVVADGVDRTAYFTTDISAWTQVTLDANRTIGHLLFSDPGADPQGWRLSSNGPVLTLSTTGGVPTITTSTGTGIVAPISGSQGFQKLGSAQLYLSGNSTYTGVTTVREGSIQASSTNALGASGSGNHTVVANGTYVDVDYSTNEDFIITGTGSGAGALNLDQDNTNLGGRITLDGNATIYMGSHGRNPSITGDISLPDSAILTLEAPSDEPFKVYGTISGTGGLTPDGAVLYASNTFSGDTTVNGRLRLMNDNALQNSTVQMNQPYLGFDSGVLAPNVGGLAGSADLNLSQDSVTRTLTVGSNGQDTTYSGNLQGAGSSLIKTGVGVLTLTGSNLYTGGTTVNDGTLVAGYNNALGSGSVSLDGGLLRIADAVTISNSLSFGTNGGTLGGRGTYLGDLTVGAKGTVAPGSSPGLLTIDGDYTQGSLASLDIELGGLTRGNEYDALVVTGDVTLAGTLNVALYGGFNPAAGNSFDILDWGTLTGTFDAVNLQTLSSGLYWDTSALYTSGTLSVYSNAQPVPVPGAAALALLGLATATGLIRKHT